MFSQCTLEDTHNYKKEAEEELSSMAGGTQPEGKRRSLPRFPRWLRAPLAISGCSCRTHADHMTVKQLQILSYGREKMPLEF